MTNAGMHRCPNCNRRWIHAYCMAVETKNMTCPDCDDMGSMARPWEYIDEFESWVIDAREKGGVSQP
jgi:hypothetical protein